jgi:hypothetical protein
VITSSATPAAATCSATDPSSGTPRA